VGGGVEPKQPTSASAHTSALPLETVVFNMIIVHCKTGPAGLQVPRGVSQPWRARWWLPPR
jgi:hypothetical protein